MNTLSSLEKQQVGLRVPKYLLDEIDEFTKTFSVNRSEVIIEAIKSYVDAQKENIFYSESDGLYYRQDSNNKIIPLTSPINGIGLIPITNKIFLDQATNSYFIMKENKLTLVPIEEIENLNIQTKQHKTK